MKWLADYFNLSKGEKRGFTALIGIILVVMLMPFLFPYISNEDGQEARSLEDFSSAIVRYETQVAAMDTVGNEQETDNAIEYFTFNPNELNVKGWQKLGLSEKTAHIIDNYREAGGKFRKKSDLKSIYGLKDSTYQRIKDYIRLPEKEPKNARSQKSEQTGLPNKKEEERGKDSMRKKESFGMESKAKAKAKVELNKADTAALAEVYGIGPVFSERLVKYRDLLGGYYDKSQLLEVYGLDSSHYENMVSGVKVNKKEVDKLPLNNADFETLQAHPYLEYSEVLAIVNYREEVDTIKNKKELVDEAIIGKDLYNKVAPYLKP